MNSKNNKIYRYKKFWFSVSKLVLWNFRGHFYTTFFCTVEYHKEFDIPEYYPMALLLLVRYIVVTCRRNHINLSWTYVQILLSTRFF